MLADDIQRRVAIAELLAQPDPPELPRRGHRLRLYGKATRYALLPDLAAAFVQRKLLALQERRAAAVGQIRQHRHSRPRRPHHPDRKEVLTAA